MLQPLQNEDYSRGDIWLIWPNPHDSLGITGWQGGPQWITALLLLLSLLLSDKSVLHWVFPVEFCLEEWLSLSGWHHLLGTHILSKMPFVETIGTHQVTLFEGQSYNIHTLRKIMFSYHSRVDLGEESIFVFVILSSACISFRNKWRGKSFFQYFFPPISGKCV